MGFSNGPAIITNGLTMALDASDKNSYPGSGNVWQDISGNGNNMTLYNSPTNNGNVFQFNGTTQYADNSLNYSAATFTIVSALRYSGATRGRILASVSNNWLLGGWNNTSAAYYAEGWIHQPVGSDTNWRIIAATENDGADVRSLWINNVVTVTNSNGGDQGFNGLSVSRSGIYDEKSTCEVGFIYLYNRILTQAELTQIYEATKNRFGLK